MQRGCDGGEDGLNVRVAINSGEDAAPLVPVDDRCGLGLVLDEAVGKDFDIIIGAASEGAGAARARIGGVGNVHPDAEDAAALLANDAMGNAIADERLVSIDQNGELHGFAALVEHRLEGIGLADSAGITVEHPCAIVGGEPLADDLDGDLIGDQEAALEEFRRTKSGGSAGGLLLAEHRADGGGVETELFFQQLRLGTLASSGRP